MTPLFSHLSQAQAVTLTVAQAFRVAFEFWQAAKEGISCLSFLLILAVFVIDCEAHIHMCPS